MFALRGKCFDSRGGKRLRMERFIERTARKGKAHSAIVTIGPISSQYAFAKHVAAQFLREEKGQIESYNVDTLKGRRNEPDFEPCIVVETVA